MNMFNFMINYNIFLFKKNSETLKQNRHIMQIKFNEKPAGLAQVLI